jgi:KDO2-lipid IV(A) lauroyltransferase
MLMRFAAAVPPRWRDFVAGRMAAIDRDLSVGRREGLRENLERLAAWGHPRARREEDRDALERAMFRSYHLGLLEYAAAREARDANPPVRITGAERLYRALEAGRGAVITAPHLGSWERGGLALAKLGFRIHVVTGIQFHAAFAAAERDRKERARISVSTPDEGFVPLVRTLRAGGLVLLLADGDVFTRAMPFRFFGVPTPIPVGPALLARRTGAPIVHGYTVRDGGGDRVVFESVDHPDRSLGLDADLRRLTEGVAGAMECAIAGHVPQWCIFRPLGGSATRIAPPAPATAVHAS